MIVRLAKVFFIGILLLGVGIVGSSRPISAQPTAEPFNEDVRSTKHNLSANPIGGRFGGDPTLFRQLFSPDDERNVQALPPQAGGTSEVCVFCHTPHGANPAGVGIQAPIWNKKLSAAHYTLYDQVWSKSFEARIHPGAPTGYSRLCLSCHDGTIALGNTINKGGSGGFRASDYEMEYPTGQLPAHGLPGHIPVGEGATSQNTRFLGTDLRNDHPISMVFDSALLSKDSEFVDPGPPIRRPFTQSTPTPISPMRRATGESTAVFDSVQCTSCHNPHQVDFPKFLRANRFQSMTNATSLSDRSAGPASPTGGPTPGQTIICLFCHDKPGWPYNAAEFNTHFGDSQQNEFDRTRLKPGATDLHADEAPTVAERACLGCHDPHTRQGAVRLLREGADAFGNVAIEQTCYQCHQPQATSILQPHGPTTAPDIQTQFFKDREGNSNHGQDSGTGTGSAMDLRLSLGHQPVFVDLPREGVQLGSDNCRPSFFGGRMGGDPCGEVPAGNKIPTENAPPTPDTSHVECVDCHNMHRVTRRNRFQGMPGIMIDGRIVAETLQQVGERREPYIYEVCLRCHGNSFNNHVREALFTALGTGNPVQARGNNPFLPGRGVNAGGSNKRKEFDPTSVPFFTQIFQTILNPSQPTEQFMPVAPPTLNTAYHPVAAIGRNQSGVLNNFTNLFGTSDQGQLLGSEGLDRTKTIQCTDCHNTDLFGTYLGLPPVTPTFLALGFPTLQNCFDGTQNVNCPDYPGPITYDWTRGNPIPPGRPNDLLPSIPKTAGGFQAASLDDANTPQGPHGSIYKRILRANYDTNVGTATNRPPGTFNPPFSYDSNNFALCFNCHAEEAFTTPYWDDPGFSNGACDTNPDGSSKAPRSRLTNFYRCGTLQKSGGDPGPNLHYIHLISRTNARCHECHNNVHSNVEAGNTIFIGLNDPQFVIDNAGHDRSTHLINFQPNVEKLEDLSPPPANGHINTPGPLWGAGHLVNPADYAAGHRGPGCFLRCHGFMMRFNTDAHSVLNGAK